MAGDGASKDRYRLPSGSALQWHDHMNALAAGNHRDAVETDVAEQFSHLPRRGLDPRQSPAPRRDRDRRRAFVGAFPFACRRASPQMMEFDFDPILGRFGDKAFRLAESPCRVPFSPNFPRCRRCRHCRESLFPACFWKKAVAIGSLGAARAATAAGCRQDRASVPRPWHNSLRHRPWCSPHRGTRHDPGC